MKYLVLFGFLLFTSLHSSLFAQTIPVGVLEDVEDVYRRDQLLGLDSLNRSFMIRPLFIQSESEQPFRKLMLTSDEYKAKVYLLPIVLQQQMNHRPFGSNDGAMITNKGYGAVFSAGVYVEVGPVSLQLRPEYVYAENKKFRSILATTNAADFVSSYQRLMSSIDMPERFGDKPYSKLNLGQSSLRVAHEGFSFGISNENIWWGPGTFNSLLMSNNAPGFVHFTLNTVKPLETPAGNVEAQLILGTLKSSGVRLPEQLNLDSKHESNRQIAGFAITYQPKWVEGLYLGFDHTSVTNKKKNKKEWPEAQLYVSNLNKNQNADNYSSFFAKWVMPEAKAEFYLQYGFKKYNFELPATKTEPSAQHSDNIRAYIAGFSKLIPTNREDDEFIKVGVELTEMNNKNVRNLYPWPSWYNSYVVTDGYTNKGQVLGAAVGPGGSMQSLEVAWVKGFKRIGFQVDRMVQNNDMFYSMRPYTADIRRHWVEFALGGKIDWEFNRFLINSKLTYIRSLNYQYMFDRPADRYKDFWDWNKQDAQNLQLKLGVMYRF
ncbi:MAG TPA: capsule assembly Wzi family protein [Pedobacter sp.]|nr:capsule assembly Wzi family protein [Pedobacter sp.]